jgi:hypothetical protein
MRIQGWSRESPEGSKTNLTTVWLLDQRTPAQRSTAPRPIDGRRVSFPEDSLTSPREPPMRESPPPPVLAPRESSPQTESFVDQVVDEVVATPISPLREPSTVPIPPEPDPAPAPAPAPVLAPAPALRRSTRTTAGQHQTKLEPPPVNAKLNATMKSFT